MDLKKAKYNHFRKFCRKSPTRQCRIVLHHFIFKACKIVINLIMGTIMDINQADEMKYQLTTMLFSSRTLAHRLSNTNTECINQAAYAVLKNLDEAIKGVVELDNCIENLSE